MKKILMACGVAAALVSMASCGAAGSAAGDNDSISATIGEFNGSQLNMQFAQLPEEMKAKFNKQDMLKGIEYILTTDTTKQNYMTGMQIAMQLWGQLYQMEQNGIKVDRKALLDAYKKAFLADSVTDMAEIAGRHQTIMNEISQKMMAAQEEKAAAERKAKENSPEAKKAVEAGKAYVADLMKKDPSIKKTASGLAYKVVSEGNGETPADRARVTVDYKGTLTNGKEFDANNGAKFPLNGVIPGFAEGLKLMKKGAHYILYIPGDLAYGPDGTPDGSIGPMETLIFDVTLTDFENPEAAKPATVKPAN